MLHELLAIVKFQKQLVDGAFVLRSWSFETHQMIMLLFVTDCHSAGYNRTEAAHGAGFATVDSVWRVGFPGDARINSTAMGFCFPRVTSIFAWDKKFRLLLHRKMRDTYLLRLYSNGVLAQLSFEERVRVIWCAFIE